MKKKLILIMLVILLIGVCSLIYSINTPSLDIGNVHAEKYVETTKYTSGKIEKDYHIDVTYDFKDSNAINEMNMYVVLYNKEGCLIGEFLFKSDAELYEHVVPITLSQEDYENLGTFYVAFHTCDENDIILNYTASKKVENGQNIESEIDDIKIYTPQPSSTSESPHSQNNGKNGNSYSSYSDTSGYGNYVGNSNTHKFHQSFCSWADNIKSGNRVSFSSREDAINSGYSPCGHCNP